MTRTVDKRHMSGRRREGRKEGRDGEREGGREGEVDVERFCTRGRG